MDKALSKKFTYTAEIFKKMQNRKRKENFKMTLSKNHLEKKLIL